MGFGGGLSESGPGLKRAGGFPRPGAVPSVAYRGLGFSEYAPPGPIIRNLRRLTQRRPGRRAQSQVDFQINNNKTVTIATQ